MKAAVGKSETADAHAAGVEAVEFAIHDLDDQQPSLALVYAAVGFDQSEVLAGVKSVLPHVPLIGASTAGEITLDGPSINHSVVVMLLSLPGAKIVTAKVPLISEKTFDKGILLAETLQTQLPESPDLLLLHADGLTANVSSLLRGLVSVFGPNTPIVGGSAGDDGRYQETFQYHNSEVYSDAAVAVAIKGIKPFAVGVKHGWNPIGLPKRVTKAEDSVVHEIDGRPAISMYKDYLGEDIEKELENKTLAEVALSYPIGILHPESGEMLLRAPFFVDERGSITCGGEVPEGSEIRLMLGSKAEAIAAAKEAAADAIKKLGAAKPKAALVFSGNVRDQLYGNREEAKKEILAVSEVIGKTVPLAGFYTYAEQAPVDKIGTKNVEQCSPSEFRNETIVILLLGE